MLIVSMTIQYSQLDVCRLNHPPRGNDAEYRGE